MEFSEQELQRRNAAQELRNLGINPYPAPMFHINTDTEEIATEFEKDENYFTQNCNKTQDEHFDKTTYMITCCPKQTSLPGPCCMITLRAQ